MNRTLLAFAATAALALAGGAHAQASGGPDAKGNAPLKHVHTVNDGAAKRGANSFTQDQARKHILNAGYTAVSGLTKGDDGVWRGAATKDGVSRNVALDFKGNVSEAGPVNASDSAASRSTPPPAESMGATPSGAASSGAMTSTTTTSETRTASATTHHRRKHRHHGSRCANPTPNGTACSGVDRNANGISDKEDRAIARGAKP